MARTYVKLFCSFNRDVAALTMEERGRLITAIVDYAGTGAVDESMLTGNERILFPVFRNQLDRDAEAYEAQARQNRLNGAKGGRPPKAQNNPMGFSETEKSQDKDKDKEKEEDKDKEKDEGEGEDQNREAVPGKGPDGPEPAPTLEEIEDYCRENALMVDGATFWNYYEANGWMAGDRPIRSWQAKLREWNARDGTGAGSRRSPSRPESANPALNYIQRDYRDEDFEDCFYNSP